MTVCKVPPYQRHYHSTTGNGTSVTINCSGSGLKVNCTGAIKIRSNKKISCQLPGDPGWRAGCCGDDSGTRFSGSGDWLVVGGGGGGDSVRGALLGSSSSPDSLRFLLASSPPLLAAFQTGLWIRIGNPDPGARKLF
jgi:hypothetical protein